MRPLGEIFDRLPRGAFYFSAGPVPAIGAPAPAVRVSAACRCGREGCREVLWTRGG